MREMLEKYRTKDRWVDFEESEDEFVKPQEEKQQGYRQPSLPPAPPTEGAMKNVKLVSVSARWNGK